MTELIILLIIIQGILMIAGYVGLARQIKSVKKRLEAAAGLAAGIPLITYGVPLIMEASRGILNVDGMTNFLTFYFISIIVNGFIGLIIEMIEGIIPRKPFRR